MARLPAAVFAALVALAALSGLARGDLSAADTTASAPSAADTSVTPPPADTSAPPPKADTSATVPTSADTSAAAPAATDTSATVPAATDTSAVVPAAADTSAADTLAVTPPAADTSAATARSAADASRTYTTFQEVPLPAPPARPHRAAYLCMGLGAGLVAISFVLANEADVTYDRYLAASSPSDITRLYDETVRYDKLSSGSLLAGEALFAAGVYLRLLHRPTQRLQAWLGPGGCALSYRF